MECWGKGENDELITHTSNTANWKLIPFANNTFARDQTTELFRTAEHPSVTTLLNYSHREQQEESRNTDGEGGNGTGVKSSSKSLTQLTEDLSFMKAEFQTSLLLAKEKRGKTTGNLYKKLATCRS